QYESGEGNRYVSRKTALKMLQLSLKDFRKLCILKGIYPREPRNRKRAQKGAPGIKTLYHLKDIQFLMHEPIIWKLRDYKIFAKKMGKARALRDFEAIKRYLENRPHVTLDHIVKERYPSFVDAIRDLDDCLSLLFMFSTFPSLQHVPRDQSALCRRLTIEFLHAVIASQALRNVFVSIKGYYFQAEIKGQKVTWIVPHHFCFAPQSTMEVDFRIMSTFVQFYSVLLGFVNFRLYHLLNLHYPPTFAVLSADATEKTLVDEEAFVSERVAALNVPLFCTGPTVEEEVEMDQFPMIEDQTKLEEVKQEAEKVKKQKTLFKGLKFFINREVPREPVVFTIRCFGGEVSWDKLLFVGAAFDESDESITHQIVDRPHMGKQYISRYYVQPQWIFDSVNACELLPVEKYFLGAVLPPHLSPFIDKTRQLYVTPEERALEDPSLAEINPEDEEESEDEESEKKDEEGESEEEVLRDDEESEKANETELNKKDEIMEKKKKQMSVSMGIVAREDPTEKRHQERQEHKLREKMIKKKHRNLYRSMMKGR
ncbi:Pescadillo-like protein, partial [Zootermopsis nevadensis]